LKNLNTKFFQPFFKYSISLLTLTLCLFLFTAFANSAEVTLLWDPNSESDLAGYKVYYGTNPDGQYEGTDAGQGASPITLPLENLSDVNNPEYTLTGLDGSKIYYFVVTAFDTEDLESDFSNEVKYGESSPGSQVDDFYIDNGDGGTLSTGSWAISGGANPYGDSSLYSKESGATYAFEASIDGYHEVSLWWTNWTSRCSDIPVEIYDGQTLLDTVYIDQQVDGGQWNSQGSYQFNGTARVVVVSEGECSTNADAVRFLGDNSVKTYTITASSGSNGSISPTDIITVDHGATQTFSIAPVEGYHIEDVKIDNTSVGALSTYTFENIGENHSISASFAATNTYTITASAGANGSISPAGSVPVIHGSNQTFTITQNDGYHVMDVFVDGSSVGPVTAYTFNNVTGTHSISASFAANTYNITASAGANGSISPAGSVPVTHGLNQTFTITQNDGYHVSDILVDGSSVGPVTIHKYI
jgi:hypothetical protein